MGGEGMSGKRLRQGETVIRLLRLDVFVAVAVTVSVLVGEFTGHDMTVSGIVAGLWDAQLAAVIGFYFWKRKNENRSRHAMALVRELADEYGIDATARIAEIVLKE